MAQRQVTQTNVRQQTQGMTDRAMSAEVIGGFFDAHAQHVTNTLATQDDFQCFAVEASPATSVASDFHVGQEAHLDGLLALAIASRTTSA